jgi:hypothetical protein
VQVIQEVEKIVQVRSEEVRIEEVVTVVEKPVFHEVLKEIEKIVPYISESIKEVKVNVNVPFAQNTNVIQAVPTIIEKVVVVNNDVPRIYEVERLFEKMVEVHQIVELPIETPVLVRVNQIIESIREKPIEIPIIHQ